MDIGFALEVCAKVLLYVPLLVAIGSSAARWLLLRRTAADFDGGSIMGLERSAAFTGLAAGCLIGPALCLRVWAHTFMVFGLEGAESWDSIRRIAFESRWGYQWKFQAGAAAIYLVTCAATCWRRVFWPCATLAVAILTATVPLLGHAAGSVARIALHTVHIFAAGVWLGTLAVVVLTPFSHSADAAGKQLSGGRIRLLLLAQFSPIAMSGAAIVVSAGAIMAWLYLNAVSDLWTTAYGQLLALKTALVGLVAICGYFNWQRLRLRAPENTPRTIVTETIFALAVVIVTAFVTETGHP